MADVSLVSAAVLSSDAATAAQYNNVRTDAIAHVHSGGNTPVPHLLNTKYLEVETAAAATKSVLGATAGDVLVLGASGLTLSLVNNAGTLTLPTATSTLVSLISTDTLTNKTLTSPKIGTAINDTNGLPLLVFTATGSALNGVTITNGATGNGPTIGVGGPSAETTVDLTVQAAATGQIKVNSGTYASIQSYTPAGGGTATLDLSKGDIHHITMPAGNITIALSNSKAGQVFLVRILQDSVGSRTITWFTTIKWAGGSAPTLTTTASKVDTVAFEVTTAGSAYDGFVVGQNI